MIKAVIIDDETSGIRSLQIQLARIAPDVSILATTTNPKEGIEIITELRPELVFIDINMPGMDAFSLLKSLPNRDFSLVFTTAHREYAISAIREEAIDYLLKPIDEDELRSCINRVRQLDSIIPVQKIHSYPNMVSIAVKDGIEFVKQTEIVRLEASGSYTYFHLDNKTKHVASRSLKEYEAQLNPDLFFRCHHSHIVNLTKVVKFVSANGYFAKMTDGSEADISRKNKDVFIERLRNLAG